jgi:hypothetical protein
MGIGFHNKKREFGIPFAGTYHQEFFDLGL